MRDLALSPSVPSRSLRFGQSLRLGVAADGLALLPHANSPHYDSEPERRSLTQALVADGTLPAAYCTDDGVGLVYRGTRLGEAVSERPGRGAWHVRRGPGGTAQEEPIEPRAL